MVLLSDCSEMCADTKKAAAEEIFKAIDTEFLVRYNCQHSTDYWLVDKQRWMELKKKFGVD
jgi:hypothetical protein